MKKYTFLALLALSISLVHGQTTTTIFSLGIEPSFPVGYFGDISSFGIGASAQAEFKPSNSYGLTLGAGYINYTYKANAGGGSGGFIPLLAGVKYGFSPKVYGHAQLGASFPARGGTTNFTYSPGIGFQLSKEIDALIKYTGMSAANYTYGSLGLRLAYNFGH